MWCYPDPCGCLDYPDCNCRYCGELWCWVCNPAAPWTPEQYDAFDALLAELNTLKEDVNSLLTVILEKCPECWNHEFWWAHDFFEWFYWVNSEHAHGYPESWGFMMTQLGEGIAYLTAVHGYLGGLIDAFECVCDLCACGDEPCTCQENHQWTANQYAAFDALLGELNAIKADIDTLLEVILGVCPECWYYDYVKWDPDFLELMAWFNSGDARGYPTNWDAVMGLLEGLIGDLTMSYEYWTDKVGAFECTCQENQLWNDDQYEVFDAQLAEVNALKADIDSLLEIISGLCQECWDNASLEPLQGTLAPFNWGTDFLELLAWLNSGDARGYPNNWGTVMGLLDALIEQLTAEYEYLSGRIEAFNCGCGEECPVGCTCPDCYDPGTECPVGCTCPDCYDPGTGCPVGCQCPVCNPPGTECPVGCDCPDCYDPGTKCPVDCDCPDCYDPGIECPVDCDCPDCYDPGTKCPVDCDCPDCYVAGTDCPVDCDCPLCITPTLCGVCDSYPCICCDCGPSDECPDCKESEDDEDADDEAPEAPRTGDVASAIPYVISSMLSLFTIFTIFKSKRKR